MLAFPIFFKFYGRSTTVMYLPDVKWTRLNSLRVSLLISILPNISLLSFSTLSDLTKRLAAQNHVSCLGEEPAPSSSMHSPAARPCVGTIPLMPPTERSQLSAECTLASPVELSTFPAGPFIGLTCALTFTLPCILMCNLSCGSSAHYGHRRVSSLSVSSTATTVQCTTLCFFSSSFYMFSFCCLNYSC